MCAWKSNLCFGNLSPYLEGSARYVDINVIVAVAQKTLLKVQWLEVEAVAELLVRVLCCVETAVHGDEAVRLNASGSGKVQVADLAQSVAERGWPTVVGRLELTCNVVDFIKLSWFLCVLNICQVGNHSVSFLRPGFKSYKIYLS